MKPDSQRAKRRHQRWRVVQRALRLFRRWDTYTTEHDDRGLSVKRRPHDPELLADNLKACSCWMCRNKRQVEGPTRRELKAMLD